MAKLINILAASVGGGLMLGAGFRLGEALVARETGARRDTGIDSGLADRLGAIEGRLREIETGHAAASPSAGRTPAPVAGKRENPAAAPPVQSAVQSGVQSAVQSNNEGLREIGAEIGARLRGEMRTWIEESVSERMAEVESRLRAETERSQKGMLDVFVEGVQTRVMHRISKLEEEVAGQSAAMTELRECSRRTEESMQKVLGGLDRLIVARPSPSPVPAADTPRETEEGAAAAPTGAGQPAAEHAAEQRPRPARRGIFW